jgi:chromate reductase
MKLFATCASLRAGSYNARLLALAVEAARSTGAEVDHADFHDFAMPSYDADLQAAGGMPPGAEALSRRIEDAQGILLASPEYNYSLPGHLKNAIDWISRRKPDPLRGKSALLLSASTSPAGGVRGLWQLRIPLEGNGVHVYPDMYWLGGAQSAFTPEGRFVDPKRGPALAGLVEAYLKMAAALAT